MGPGHAVEMVSGQPPATKWVAVSYLNVKGNFETIDSCPPHILVSIRESKRLALDVTKEGLGWLTSHRDKFGRVAQVQAKLLLYCPRFSSSFSTELTRSLAVPSAAPATRTRGH